MVLDPGHGGVDPGATGPGGLAEKTVNLAVASAAADLLAGRAGVLMTRRDDRTVSLAARVKTANAAGAALFVSVHCNAAANPAATGTETYHYPGSPQGTLLAGLIQHRLVSAIRRRDRGVKQANFYVLRFTTAPAALAEILFLTNPEEAALLADRAFQGTVAAALAAGITDYLDRGRLS